MQSRTDREAICPLTDIEQTREEMKEGLQTVGALCPSALMKGLHRAGPTGRTDQQGPDGTTFRSVRTNKLCLIIDFQCRKKYFFLSFS